MSAEPEITVHEVDWDEDEFVILATDGIWDVLTDKDSARGSERRLPKRDKNRFKKRLSKRLLGSLFYF